MCLQLLVQHKQYGVKYHQKLNHHSKILKKMFDLNEVCDFLSKYMFSGLRKICKKFVLLSSINPRAIPIKRI